MVNNENRSEAARILVVDDDPRVLRLLQVNLKRYGFVVETAGNGAEALIRLRARRPDVLVSDVMMPEMDGYELLANVRRDPSLAYLPIILMGVFTSNGFWYYEASLLTKPFNPFELFMIIKRLLPAFDLPDPRLPN